MAFDQMYLLSHHHVSIHTNRLCLYSATVLNLSSACAILSGALLLCCEKLYLDKGVIYAHHSELLQIHRKEAVGKALIATTRDVIIVN